MTPFDRALRLHELRAGGLVAEREVLQRQDEHNALWRLAIARAGRASLHPPPKERLAETMDEAIAKSRKASIDRQAADRERQRLSGEACQGKDALADAEEMEMLRKRIEENTAALERLRAGEACRPGGSPGTDARPEGTVG
jgi:hypothetical protein